MMKGGEHWQHDGEMPSYIGVLPRYGAKGRDVKWFEAPSGFLGKDEIKNPFQTPF
jgi:carotenoid cleavage dioxygenase